MLKDVRYAIRILLRSPLFSIVAVLSLALGIGGAVSVFTVLNAIVLRELPVPNPEQLYAADKHRTNDISPRYSWPLLSDAMNEIGGRAQVLAFTTPTTMQIRLPNRTDAAAAERGLVQLVSGEFFDVLRQRAQLGRLIVPSDNTDAEAVAVISDAYWRRRFEGNADVVGRDVQIGGAILRIIGVTAPGFFGPMVALRNPDVWVPLTLQHDVRYAFNASMGDAADGAKAWSSQRAIEWLQMIVRVPRAADVTAVESALTLMHRRDAEAQLGAGDADDRERLQRERVVLTDAGRGVSFLRGDLSSRLMVLLAMVGVLLAITCGNVASLLVARASAREREIAIRSAMGAGRWRVMRQLLIETLMLSLVGAGLGLIVAAWGRDALLAMFTGGASSIDLNTGFDWRVLLFSVSIALVCGVLAGLIPAFRSTRIAPTEAIKTQSRQVGHAGGRRGALVGKTLVAAQIAFCLLLLVVAGLFVRSMRSLMQTDVGFDRDRLMVARVDVRSMGLSDAERQTLYDRVVDRLRRIPGIESVSLSLNGPMGNSNRISSLGVEGYTPGAEEQVLANEEVVSADYFATVGLRILEGRSFTAEDERRTKAPNTIINQSMARRFFPGGDALGKRWSYDETVAADSPVIVGVVQDAKYMDVRAATPNMIYHFTKSLPGDVLGNLEIRTSAAASQMSGTIVQAVAEVDPGLLVFDIVPLDLRLNRGLTNDRLIANLTSVFGTVALLLACLGLYGTVSYGVTRRVAELGLRMALGANRGNVLWLVVRESLTLVVIGAAAGLPLAVLASRSVVSLLHGVEALDPIAYTIATTLLLMVACVGAYLPAHRASRIDPMVALRLE